MKRFLAVLALVLAPSIAGAQSLDGSFQPAYVEGNIRAEDTGKPLVGAKIDVVGAKVSSKGIKESSGCGAGFAMSAANGNFAVGVGRINLCTTDKHPFNGKYYVTVAKRGYLPQTQLVDFGAVRGANEIGALEFTLTPSHSSITGQVFGSGGKPLPYAYAFVVKNIYAMALKPPKGHVPFLMSEMPAVRADGYGKFTIPVSPGDYIVMASKPGYQLATKTVNPLAVQLYQRMTASPFAGAMMKSRLAQLEQPQLGVAVHVIDAGSVVVNLTMIAAALPLSSAHPVIVRQAAYNPTELRLIGSARSSPNNVLFFANDLGAYGSDRGHRYSLSVERSRVLLGATKIDPFKSHIKTFNFALYGPPSRVGCRHKPGDNSIYGCGNSVYSFTDETAVPGRLYYYYIVEGSPNVVGPNGKIIVNQVRAPNSNAVQIITH